MGKLSNLEKEIRKMAAPDRVSCAKKHIVALTSYILETLELHENNKIIFYSDTLSKQIPQSFAANAFMTMQHAMYRAELVSLCSIWGKPDVEDATIPTVVALIDHPEVIDIICRETYFSWGADLTELDPEEIKLIPEEDMPLNRHYSEIVYGIEKAVATRKQLLECISKTMDERKSKEHDSILNFRHKNIAHRLTQTRLEKTKPIQNLKYGQEKPLLNSSIKIIQDLYLCICNSDFNINEECRVMFANAAEELWNSCTFNIPN